MEIALSLSILFSALLIALRSGWKPVGWLKAWMFLVGMSSVSRFSLALFPRQTPFLLSFLWFGVFLLLLRLSRDEITRNLKKFAQWEYLGILGLSVFILIRNFHPQYDVDSLAYHLQAVRWLYDRPLLPPLHQEIDNLAMQFRLIGFEEFLLAPAVNRDLAFFAGLLGGVFKLLCWWTLLSFSPGRTPIFRAMITFLVLIDDHFLYSGQSKYVYLNPTFIAWIALSGYFSWRVLRGHTRSMPLAIAAGVGAACTKFYGLLFLGVMGAACLYRFVRNRKLPLISKSTALSFLLPAVLGIFSVYGLNWIETGTPIYPAGAKDSAKSTMVVQSVVNMTPGGSIRDAILHPMRTMIFPGNMAMKVGASLLFPALVLWVFRKRRGFSFAAFALSLTLLWAVIAEMIAHNESRYRRYAYGLCILAILFFVRALRRRSLFQRIPYSVSIAFSVIVSLAIAYGMEWRYFNIPLNYRTGVKENWEYVKKGRPPAIDHDYMTYVEEIQPLAGQNIHALRECLGTPDLERGLGLIVFGPMNWPSYLIAPNAVRGDQLSFFRWIPGSKLCQAVFPKTWLEKGIPDELKSSPDAYQIAKAAIKSPEICTSTFFKVVRFDPCYTK